MARILICDDGRLLPGGARVNPWSGAIARLRDAGHEVAWVSAYVGHGELLPVAGAAGTVEDWVRDADILCVGRRAEPALRALLVGTRLGGRERPLFVEALDLPTEEGKWGPGPLTVAPAVEELSRALLVHCGVPAAEAQPVLLRSTLWRRLPVAAGAPPRVELDAYLVPAGHARERRQAPYLQISFPTVLPPDERIESQCFTWSSEADHARCLLGAAVARGDADGARRLMTFLGALPPDGLERTADDLTIVMALNAVRTTPLTAADDLAMAWGTLLGARGRPFHLADLPAAVRAGLSAALGRLADERTGQAPALRHLQGLLGEDADPRGDLVPEDESPLGEALQVLAGARGVAPVVHDAELPRALCLPATWLAGFAQEGGVEAYVGRILPQLRSARGLWSSQGPVNALAQAVGLLCLTDLEGQHALAGFLRRCPSKRVAMAVARGVIESWPLVSADLALACLRRDPYASTLTRRAVLSLPVRAPTAEARRLLEAMGALDASFQPVPPRVAGQGGVTCRASTRAPMGLAAPARVRR